MGRTNALRSLRVAAEGDRACLGLCGVSLVPPETMRPRTIRTAAPMPLLQARMLASSPACPMAADPNARRAHSPFALSSRMVATTPPPVSACPDNICDAGHPVVREEQGTALGRRGHATEDSGVAAELEVMEPRLSTCDWWVAADQRTR